MALNWRTRLTLAVCAGGAVLAVASLAFVWRGPQWWRVFFAVTSEQNLPTWYSTAALLGVAATATLVGGLAHAAQPRLAYRWWILAALFAALSIDEMAGLHEQLEPLGARVLEPGGVFHFVWVVPGALLALIAVAMVVQLARRLPQQARRQLYAGLAVFLGAAVGLELAGGWVLSEIGTGWRYQLVSTTEEFTEVVGTAVVLHACTQMIEATPADPGVRLRYAGSAAADDIVDTGESRTHRRPGA